MAFASDQCGTERAHDTRDVGTDHVTACNLFKAAQNRIIIKCTALYDDLGAEL